MEEKKYRGLNLTTGNLFVKMLKFALPFMMTTFFQLLYTTIDLWTVSKYGGGALSMAAIGSNNSLIHLIISFLISIAIGSNVIMSIAKGSNDKLKASNVLNTSFSVSIIGGLFFAIIGYFASPVILQIMDTPESILYKASTYLRIYFLGIPFLAIYNYGSQMLRALGDSKRPFIILVLSGIINIIFDLIFVIVFKLDVAGVALATIISEMISAILVLIWFRFNKNDFIQFRFKNLKIYKTELIEILKIGIPSGLQGIAFCLPNVMIQSSLYTITNLHINNIAISVDEIVAGASASSQVEGYIYAMLDAFAVALVSFVGQNYGAHKKENIKKSFWYANIWMLTFLAFAMIIIAIIPFDLLAIFIKPSDDIVLKNALLAGKQRLFILGFTYFLDGIMDIFGSYLKGMKKSVIPAVVTIVGCTGTRIFFLLTLFKQEYFHTIIWLYAVFPISWILCSVTYIPLTLVVQKKEFAKI